MFEAGGGEDVALSWSGGGIARERVPASAFSINTLTLQPPWEAEVVDEILAAKGESLFLQLGCTACHEPSLPHPAAFQTIPPFASLTPNRGCISAAPEPALPNYDFTSEERRAINVVLENPAGLDEPLPAHSLLPTL